MMKNKLKTHLVTLILTVVAVAPPRTAKPANVAPQHGDKPLVAEQQNSGPERQKEGGRHVMPSANSRATNRGFPTEGFQLSLRFAKKTFTNSEPIIAYITLRNATNTTLAYYISPRRTDMTVALTGDRGKLARNDLHAKPGASPQERAKYIDAGNTAYLQLPVGGQREFSLDLTRMYDLAPGKYSAVAMRKVPKAGRDAVVEVSSAEASFEVISDHPGE